MKTQRYQSRTPSMIGSVCSIASFAFVFASEGDIEDEAYVSHLRAGEILENGNEIEKFVVVSIGEPTADGNGVLGVEDI
jgi:hypothetical protein